MQDSHRPRLLKTLRDSNQEKWASIEDNLNRVPDSTNTDDWQFLVDTLQSLQKEIKELSSSTMVNSNSQCLELLEKIVPEFACVEDSGFYPENVANTSLQLFELNDILQSAIKDECYSLQHLEASIQENVELQKLLQDEVIRAEETMRCCNDDLADDLVSHETQIKPGQSKKNEQIQKDLRFLVSCVSGTEGTSLFELIRKLSLAAVKSNSDPFISIQANDVHQDDVGILRQCWIIDSFKSDDTLIRLLDYSI